MDSNSNETENKKVFNWNQRMAENEDSFSQFDLGYLYEKGKGTEKI